MVGDVADTYIAENIGSTYMDHSCHFDHVVAVHDPSSSGPACL
jgi:hypothetical protein